MELTLFDFGQHLAKWLEHDPVGMTLREYQFLSRLTAAVRPVRILEIGPGCGASTLAMLCGYPALIQQVTIHEGSGRILIPSEFHHHLQTFYGTSDAFFQQNSQQYGLILIDGDHSYSAVANDLNNSLGCLAEDGVIVLHDICQPGSEYISDLANNAAGICHKSYYEYRVGNGLGVVSNKVYVPTA